MSPVPVATVEYVCEMLLIGHLVSINKTATAGWGHYNKMLPLDEVPMLGYKAGTKTILYNTSRKKKLYNHDFIQNYS